MSGNTTVIIGAVEAIFFGVYSLRLLPTVTELVSSLCLRTIHPWPGPPVRYPDGNVSMASQWLGTKDFLFPFFLKYAGAVVAACILSGMSALNVIFLWIIPKEGKEWAIPAIPLLLSALAGLPSMRRALFAQKLVRGELHR